MALMRITESLIINSFSIIDFMSSGFIAVFTFRQETLSIVNDASLQKKS